MRVFWKQGFEGTSLDDLTDAMGINRPSLYAAFGNKESLFRKVVEKYANSSCGQIQAALALPTAREVVTRLLSSSIPEKGADRPAGCLLVQGALACSAEARPMQAELTERRAAAEKLLRQRFERSIREGDLPAEANAASLARFVSTVLHGLSVQATSGATREQMLAVVDVAIEAIPKPGKKR